MVIECLGRGSPAQGLAGPGVEGCRDGREVPEPLCCDRSVPFGKYWRSRPLVFSLVPRCHGLCGSQK